MSDWEKLLYDYVGEGGVFYWAGSSSFMKVLALFLPLNLNPDLGAIMLVELLF